MAFQFSKHYTLEEARSLLPQIRLWLESIDGCKAELTQIEEHLNGLLTPGRDLGGDVVNRYLRKLGQMKSLILEFDKRHIVIKDMDRGLIDFPSVKDGKEVFLCWEKDEDDIEFWHDLDSGYSGRERV